MKATVYMVFRAADGCAEEYLGTASSLDEARIMAAQHARGERLALPESLYETARVAGHVDGISAPPSDRAKIGDPVEWFGPNGWYCACAELEAR